MKKQMILLILILFITLFFNTVYANEYIDDMINSDAVQNLSDITKDSENINMAYEDFSFTEFVKGITESKGIFNPKSVFLKLLKILFKEVYSNIATLTILIVLAIISMLITNLNSSFNSKSTAEVAFFAFYLMYTGILTASFFSCYESAKKVITEQSAFMQAATPTYISMLVATGNIGTSSVMKPIFLYSISLITKITLNFLLPGTVIIFIMSTVNNLASRVHITKLISLLKLVLNKTLTIMTTLFITMLSLAGIGASAVDKMGVRVAKYAVGNFVPVVGGILSDTVDTVVSSALALKNALGIAGIVVVILICAYPLIKFIALIFIYKLASGLIEVFAEKRISDAVSDASDGISLMFTMLLCTAIVFVLSITVLIVFAKGAV